jgi:hypothetical protein
MVSGGLSHTDVDRQEHLIGGLALRFFQQMAAHYGQSSGWSFEPHVAEESFRAMLSDAHVQLFASQQIEDLERNGSAIRELLTMDHQRFAGKVFIDSSYEGDLMKAAHVSYTVGREGKDKYGESLAGRMDLLPGVHQFPIPVLSDGLTGGNASVSSVAPHITKQEDLASTGTGDGRFQSYCYRLILTDDPRNRIAVGAPPGYDASNYELLKRYIQSNPGLTLKGVLGINRIPNGKGDANSNGPVSLDFLGANLQYPRWNAANTKRDSPGASALGPGARLLSAKRSKCPKGSSGGRARMGPAKGRVCRYGTLAEPALCA